MKTNNNEETRLLDTADNPNEIRNPMLGTTDIVLETNDEESTRKDSRNDMITIGNPLCFSEISTT